MHADCRPPLPLLKSDQIEFLIPREAQCSETYAKNNFSVIFFVWLNFHFKFLRLLRWSGSPGVGGGESRGVVEPPTQKQICIFFPQNFFLTNFLFLRMICNVCKNKSTNLEQKKFRAPILMKNVYVSAHSKKKNVAK